jgi:hypothetical protein
VNDPISKHTEDTMSEQAGGKKPIPKPNTWLFLSAVFLPLSTAIGAIFLLIRITKILFPELFVSHPASIVEILLGIAGLLIALIFGFCIGVIMLVIIWRPFVPRMVLKRIVTEPKTPIFSKLLMRIFVWVYPDNEGNIKN